VFSTWVDVLELVAHALRRCASCPFACCVHGGICANLLLTRMTVPTALRSNGLPYAYARQAKHFHSELRRFKCESLTVPCCQAYHLGWFVAAYAQGALIIVHILYRRGPNENDEGQHIQVLLMLIKQVGAELATCCRACQWTRNFTRVS
jgi:hypothetical protein